MKLFDASWDEVRDFLKECDLAFIPAGCIEAKGFHQPMGTDAILAEKLSLQLSKRIDALVAPTFNLGHLPVGPRQFPGTIEISYETFREVIRDTCDSLAYWGVKRFVLISGHGGNAPAMMEVGDYLKEKYDAQVVYVQFNPMITAFGNDIAESENAYGHAGEIETSIMLHWVPKLTKMDKATEKQPNNIPNYPGIDRLLVTDFLRLTETGHTGNPTLATSEKGKKIIDRVLEFLVDFIQKEMPKEENTNDN